MGNCIWVTGRGTGVGKTTIACALVRALNGGGVRCAGFKPFGALRLREDVNFVLNGLPDGRLFGHDALDLARSSPLTSDELIEIVAPCYFITLFWPSELLLARSGSPILDNLRFHGETSGAPLRKRADIAAIFEQKGWSGLHCSPESIPGIDTAPWQFTDEIEASVRYLRDLGTEVLVCEGANAYLPFWPGQQVPDHILLVERSRVLVCAGHAEQHRALASHNACPTVAALRPGIHHEAGPTRMYPIPVVADTELQGMADSLAANILQDIL